jgi:hypothetical protein
LEHYSFQLPGFALTLSVSTGFELKVMSTLAQSSPRETGFKIQIFHQKAMEQPLSLFSILLI